MRVVKMDYGGEREERERERDKENNESLPHRQRLIRIGMAISEVRWVGADHRVAEGYCCEFWKLTMVLLVLQFRFWSNTYFTKQC